MKLQNIYLVLLIVVSPLSLASTMNVAIQCDAMTQPVSGTMQTPDVKDCELVPQQCGSFERYDCYWIQCRTPVVLVFGGMTYTSDIPSRIGGDYYLEKTQESLNAFNKNGFQVFDSLGSSVKSPAGYELLLGFKPTHNGQALVPTHLLGDQRCSIVVQ